MYLLRVLSSVICWVVSTSLIFPSAVFATGGSYSFSGETSAGGSGSEYVSGNYPGAVLMPINLWGAVQKPGIHHIPTKTDLITLLALAGGPHEDAELGDVVIKRRIGQQEEVLKVDAEEVLKVAGIKSPTLEANDIVIIPRDKPPINNNVASTVGFFSSIIGLTLSAIALTAALNR